MSVLNLARKGQIALMVYEMLSGSDKTVTSRISDALKMSEILKRNFEDVREKCILKMEDSIRKDTNFKLLQAPSKSSVYEKFSNILQKKYTWLSWCVIAITQHKDNGKKDRWANLYKNGKLSIEFNLVNHKINVHRKDAVFGRHEWSRIVYYSIPVSIDPKGTYEKDLPNTVKRLIYSTKYQLDNLNEFKQFHETAIKLLKENHYWDKMKVFTVINTYCRKRYNSRKGIKLKCPYWAGRKTMWTKTSYKSLSPLIYFLVLKKYTHTYRIFGIPYEQLCRI